MQRRSVGSLPPMSFGPGQLRGGAGVIDYRLARRALITEYRKGRLARHQVCDAHPELVRNAQELGEASRVDCPICAEDKLVLVTYVFGPGLPSHGRCISRKGELAQLHGRSGDLKAYVVEVCRVCAWHHLTRTFPMGKGTTKRAAGS